MRLTKASFVVLCFAGAGICFLAQTIPIITTMAQTTTVATTTTATITPINTEKMKADVAACIAGNITRAAQDACIAGARPSW